MAGDWTTATLEEVCATITDGAHLSPKEDSFGLPMASVKDLTRHGIDLTSCKRISRDAFAMLKHQGCMPKIGDVLIAKDGNSALDTVCVHRLNEEVVLLSSIAILRPSKRIDPDFLRYYLDAPQTRDLLKAGFRSGSAIPRVVLKDFRRAPVKLPPLPEQRVIAHILRALDDKIELNRRMNETLEAIARAMFKSWFVDFDPVNAKADGRDPGLPQPIADRFPDSFEDSELGEIPKGWRVGTLGEVAEHLRRVVNPSQVDASTPYIGLEHMPKRCISLSEWGVADGLESNKFEFKRGEVLFGKLRPYFHKVGVAPVDGVSSTDIVVVTPRAEKWFGFVLGHVSSEAFVEHTNAGSTGTRMPRTSWTDMARYVVVLPDESLAKAFTDQTRPIVSRILASIHESRSLAAIRDTLLPKLISGELRVKDAERALEKVTA